MAIFGQNVGFCTITIKSPLTAGPPRRPQTRLDLSGMGRSPLRTQISLVFCYFLEQSAVNTTRNGPRKFFGVSWASFSREHSQKPTRMLKIPRVFAIFGKIGLPQTRFDLAGMGRSPLGTQISLVFATFWSKVLQIPHRNGPRKF